MIKPLTNLRRYGVPFMSKKKAVEYRILWNKQSKLQGVNLRYRIFKRGKRYIVTQESTKLI